MAHLTAVREMLPPHLMRTPHASSIPTTAAVAAPPPLYAGPDMGAVAATSPPRRHGAQQQQHQQQEQQLGVVQQLMRSAQKNGHAAAAPGAGPGWLLDSLFVAHDSHPHHPPTLARRLEASRDEAGQLGRQLDAAEHRIVELVRDDKAMMHQLQAVARRISNSFMASVRGCFPRRQRWWRLTNA
jgi:hypothetical protein